MKVKVLISDSMSAKATEIFNSHPEIECDVITDMTPEELKAKIGEYHGLAIRSSTTVTAEILEAATNLKVIGRAGIGVDNIDSDVATQKGVIVMNTPGGNTTTTAEHAIAMMMALARNIPQATASMRAGKWEKKRFQGTELTAKTLGILGVGNIGSIVASRAIGLKMNVLAFDPYISTEAADKMGITLVEKDELLAKSDFISVHMPVTPETRNMIGTEAFAKMKKGVRLINCARGGIVNEADLVAAIEDGTVAGAALDVFETEPTTAGNPVLERDEIILTPHLGASTHEAQENVAIAIAEQISDYLINGTVRNALNVPSVPAELLASLGPYISLGEALGSFQGQTLMGGIEEITVEYSGDVVEYDIAPVTIACIKGLLDQVLDTSVNFVNAPFVAKERGIKVVEVKSSRSTDFTSAITIKVKTKETESLVEGALFGKSEPRIVKIDEFFLDARPEGNLLFVKNEDVPGVIGDLGTLLAKSSVNIAQLHLGRGTVGGEAVSIWNIDTPLTAEILDKVMALPHMLSAKTITL